MIPLYSMCLWNKHLTGVTVHSLAPNFIRFDTWEIGNCGIPKHLLSHEEVSYSKQEE